MFREVPQETLDRAVTRNAYLIIQLRKLIAQLHQQTAGHGNQGWVRCEHEECQRVTQLLAVTPKKEPCR